MIQEWHIDRINAAGIQEVKIRSVLTCEAKNGVCAHLLRARSRPRHAGQHGRGGRRHRGAVDRRAGHAADDAHLPHRRRGADRRPVLHRVELRRHGEDPQPRARPQRRRRPDGHGAQRRGRDRGAGRRRARGAPRAVRRAAEGRRGRQGQARPAHRRVGSLHPADHDRDRRHRRLRGSRSRAPRCRSRSTRRPASPSASSWTGGSTSARRA